MLNLEHNYKFNKIPEPMRYFQNPTYCMHVAHTDIMFICPRAPIVNIGEKQKMTPPISNNKHKKQTMLRKTTKEIEEDTKIHSQVTPVTMVMNVSPYNIC